MWPTINRCEVCQRTKNKHTVFASRRHTLDFRWLVLFCKLSVPWCTFSGHTLFLNEHITSLHHAPLSQAPILRSASSPVTSVFLGQCCRTETFGMEAVIVVISKDALSKFSLATTTVTTRQQRVSSIITADSSDTMAQ